MTTNCEICGAYPDYVRGEKLHAILVDPPNIGLKAQGPEPVHIQYVCCYHKNYPHSAEDLFQSQLADAFYGTGVKGGIR